MCIHTVALLANLLTLSAALIYALILRYNVFSEKEGFISFLPVVGLQKGNFAWAKATFLSIFNTKQWAFEGYEKVGVIYTSVLFYSLLKYSKHNIPYIIPSIDRGPMVVIPPRQLRKVYGASEAVIDIHNTGNETIQTKWTIGDRKIYEQQFHMNVIRNQLTRNLDTVTPLISHELESAFKKYWGKSHDWQEVYVWDMCLKLVAGASNSIFFGAPLCKYFHGHVYEGGF
jgi:hypothetical protein